MLTVHVHTDRRKHQHDAPSRQLDRARRRARAWTLAKRNARSPWSTDPSTAMHAHNDNVRALVCARAARASVELTSLEQSLHVTEVCVQVPPVQTIRAADTDLRMGMLNATLCGGSAA